MKTNFDLVNETVSKQKLKQQVLIYEEIRREAQQNVDMHTKQSTIPEKVTTQMIIQEQEGVVKSA